MVKVQSPSGRLVETSIIDFDAKSEPWATYELSDGTVLKLRVTIRGVMRMEREFDSAGNPVYIVNSDTTVRVVKAKIRGEPSGKSSSKQVYDHDPSVS